MSTDEAHLLTWTFVQEGPEHKPTHTAVAKLGDRTLAQGVGPTRSAAKRMAAEVALKDTEQLIAR